MPPIRSRRAPIVAAGLAVAAALAAAAPRVAAAQVGTQSPALPTSATSVPSAMLVSAPGAFGGGPAAAEPTGPTEPSAREPDGRAWTERRLWLGSLRWWADPAHLERLRALAGAGLDLDVRVEWAVPALADQGITPAEREVLCDAKSTALRAGAATPPASGAATQAGAPADSAGCADGATAAGGPAGAEGGPAPGYGLLARVTEAWRPHRLLNVLIVALPGPSAPFMTQGGAASAIEVVDAAGRAVAGFECRGYAGLAQMVHAFGRIGHTRAALRECARAFHSTLRDGQLPGGAAADAGAAIGLPAAGSAYVN